MKLEFVRWTEEEEKILMEAFRSGGISLARAKIPRRSKKAIKARAHRLGIASGTNPVLSASERQRLLAFESMKKRLASMGTESLFANELAERWKITTGCISKVANRYIAEGYLIRHQDNRYQRTDKPMGDKWEVTAGQYWSGLKKKRKKATDGQEVIYAMPPFPLGEVKGMLGWAGHADLRKWHPEAR